MLDINEFLKQRQLSCNFESSNWDIKDSKISGKGVIANHDFESGDIIFREIPLASGPRAAVLPVSCVVCFKVNSPLKACGKGCRLPVCCQECESAVSHEPECQLLNQLSPKKEEHWSPFLYRALTPLRCLLLSENDKNIVRCLSANKNNKHIEITLLKREIESELSPENESFMRLSCSVLNGTAFEINIGNGGCALTLRGLFPLAGMMNHCCSPNTHHFFKIINNVPTMFVTAAKPIKKGSEVTTSYCPLLWSTMTRRHFLSLTKEFFCSCFRCQDLTEFGTYFSAHQCSCKSYILPVSPINLKSGWQCQGCRKTMPLHEVLSHESSSLKGDNGAQVHKMNYLNIQKAIDKIWKDGQPTKQYKECSKEELDEKEYIIKDLLDVNDKLCLGDSRFKGKLLHELLEILKEKKNRGLPVDEVHKGYIDLAEKTTKFENSL